ncbi:mitochondrial ATP synthase G subunit [Hirsutella rhossiliensis]|uniref:Mitochondrial ATP synthase G subunit n=1 Tax=Hirsutella rhossiliensis TaxID=111463 RepID=A0A9P8SIW3_9HYPO|nr:mitochondrial ATP synthase G subunit [Hirsutella rhossiliensis]KAH0962436.1 mitochondrial ATP synthase G subunit [Hirsutella rhossiliensis]
MAMASSSLARPVLRSRVALRFAPRRFESSAAASKVSEAAKDTASKAKEYQARAQQGLSRVTTAAGPAIVGAARGVTSALGKMGGRTGKFIAFVERQTPFVVYYSKVGLEMGKIMFHGQKMSPPSMATFQTYYQNLWRSVQNGSILQAPQNLLQQVRSLNTAHLATGGVVLAECLGFFTVGEMIGRFKIVGYRGEPGHHH